MASSVLRLVSRRAAATRWNSLVGYGVRVPILRRPYSTTSSSSPTFSSPWLMLPPVFEGNDMFYKFYSLKEDKVISISKRPAPGSINGIEELPEDDVEFVGSSHGWLASFNPRNSSLFLSDPLSRRHIRLPPLHTAAVSNLILSSSPDDEDCRAMISYGPKRRLAFCCPRRSTAWTPIGDDHHDFENMHPWVYERFVYSNTQKLFFCITISHLFEIWDLRDRRSPKMTPLEVAKAYTWGPSFSETEKLALTARYSRRLETLEKALAMWSPNNLLNSIEKARGCTWGTFGAIEKAKDYPWGHWSKAETLDIKKLCLKFKFLVFFEPTNELLLVTRYVLKGVHLDGSPVESNSLNRDNYTGVPVLFDNCFPHETIGFQVHKYKPNERIFRYMDSSLDGLALFIGSNHGFALPAAEFSELEPNSIYFTDHDIEPMIDGPDNYPGDPPHGGHDLGIYNYENRTFSPCYYPCDLKSIKRIRPAPMWFTPNMHTSIH